MEFYTLTQFNAYSHLLFWTIKRARTVCHIILEFGKKNVVVRTRRSTVSPFVTQLKKRRQRKKCLHLLGQKKKALFSFL